MLQKLIKKEKSEEKAVVKEEMCDGIDLMRIPASNPYSYGLHLMDILFTKTELSNSLLFQSKKSDKLVLDKERVSKLLELIDRRYGKDAWELEVFTSKANQKCRDTKVSLCIKLFNHLANYFMYNSYTFSSIISNVHNFIILHWYIYFKHLTMCACMWTFHYYLLLIRFTMNHYNAWSAKNYM